MSSSLKCWAIVSTKLGPKYLCVKGTPSEQIKYTSWTMWNMGLLYLYEQGINCVFQAVCCSDGRHCCPENTKCEVSSGKCMRGDSVIMDWFEKTPAMRAQNVVCPDGQSQCKTGQTCCKLSSGQYGCCPLPKVSVLEMPICFKDL